MVHTFTPASGTRRREDQQFKGIHGYVRSSRLAWARETPSHNTKRKKGRGKQRRALPEELPCAGRGCRCASVLGWSVGTWEGAEDFHSLVSPWCMEASIP